MSLAQSLARWAHDYRPAAGDLALARRSLIDTLSVALAARGHPLQVITAGLPRAARWAAMAHVLDFDDLHVETTTHISVITVPTVLAAGGDARAYLAGAGVMARLGTMLGWQHYATGWHATCTAGAPAAAVAGGIALGLDAAELATAIALAVPAAGGVQEAFGTHSKSLQVGFAAEAGLRAARLARAGATANPQAFDAWLGRVGGTPAKEFPAGPAVPGGLAIKLFPCCYAMQRPIAALRDVRARIPGEVTAVTVTTPAGTVHPLIHDRPTTGLEGKFSLPYAIATALLDDYPGFGSFTDAAVNRPEVGKIIDLACADLTPEPVTSLIDGQVSIRIACANGTNICTQLALPPGSPQRAPSAQDMQAKMAACGQDVPALMDDLTWAGAAELIESAFPRSNHHDRLTPP